MSHPEETPFRGLQQERDGSPEDIRLVVRFPLFFKWFQIPWCESVNRHVRRRRSWWSANVLVCRLASHLALNLSDVKNA